MSNLLLHTSKDGSLLTCLRQFIPVLAILPVLICQILQHTHEDDNTLK